MDYILEDFNPDQIEEFLFIPKISKGLPGSVKGILMEKLDSYLIELEDLMKSKSDETFKQVIETYKKQSKVYALALRQLEEFKDYKIKKQHVFSLTYRYQNVNDSDDDNETNIHMIGLGYKYKF